jgi:hypothetical protein
MVGSMLISGRNSGQVRLVSNGPDSFQAVATKVGTRIEHVIQDVQAKLAEIKASPSPIQAEIEFLTHWLMVAEKSLKSSVDDLVKKEVEGKEDLKKDEVKTEPQAPITGAVPQPQGQADPKVTPIKPN